MIFHTKKCQFVIFSVAVWLVAHSVVVGADSGYTAFGSDDSTYSPIIRGASDPSERTWAQADYLLWWSKGMWLPPLVTTNDAGAIPDLGNAFTRVLYGDGEIIAGNRSGVRLRAGRWLGDSKSVGIEADYLYLGGGARFFAEGDGNPILGRPFFNINPNTPAPFGEVAELVSFPGRIEGSVSVNTVSELSSAGIRFVFPMCCWDYCRNSVPGTGSWTVLAGYRHMRLNETLTIYEDLTSLDPQAPGDFDVTDSFYTNNDFHGAELSTVYRLERGPWMMEVLGRLAFGTNNQVVRINGTTIAPNGTFVGGLLAQPTNIGSYSRNRFAMVPELGVTFGYQVTERLKATCGYSLVYFSNVVRPGEQIDLDVNAAYLVHPSPSPVPGPARPTFAFDDTDFWATGLNFGAEYRY